MVGTSVTSIDLTPYPVSGASRGKGKIYTTGYSVGANAAWLGGSGLYADAVGQLMGYSSNLSNTPGGNDQGWSSVLSLKVGQRFNLGSGWAVVPQAQLAWTHVDFSSFADSQDNPISVGRGDSLRGRAGARFEKLETWRDADGKNRRLQLYGIAGLSYEFLNGTSVDFSGVGLDQRNERLWGEVGLGASYAWNDNWSVYGEASYATALADHVGDDNYALSGTAGLRDRW